jgi:hypothetical protein
MNHQTTPPPSVLDRFLEELDEKAQADSYPAGIMCNMKESPEMIDILTRIVGAELKAIRQERKALGNNETC